MPHDLDVRTCIRLMLGTLILLAVPMAHRAAGQDRPPAAVEFTVGRVMTGFLVVK